TCTGALGVLFGKRKADLESLQRVQRQIAANPELDRYVLFTSALLLGDASPVELEGSGFSQKRARNVVQIANELPRFSDALSEAKSDHQRFRILSHASPELLSVVAATLPDEQQHAQRFHDFRKVDLPLRGNHLQV